MENDNNKNANNNKNNNTNNNNKVILNKTEKEIGIYNSHELQNTYCVIFENFSNFINIFNIY